MKKTKAAKAAKPATRATPAPRKAKAKAPRRRGRRLAEASVGREKIVAAARQLFEKLPPHRASVSAIARKAGVDPALVRYYFTGREQLMLAVVEDIIETWVAGHQPPVAAPTVRLGKHVGNMLDFSLKYRAMQRLLVEDCATSRSADVRRRVRELNEGALSFYRLLVHSDKHAAQNPTDPLFMYVSIIGMCEFFAAAQAMIQPLAPEGMAPAELTARYREFITRLVLDGLSAEVEPWSRRGASAT